MVYDYDNALVEELNERFNKNPKDETVHKKKIYIVSPEDTLDMNAVLSNDKIQLPIISINRLGWSLQDKRPHPLRFSGKLVEILEGDVKMYLHAMPIIINYSIDVWTNTRLENDLIMRELLWYYSLNPTLEVHIPYGYNHNHTFNIFFNNEIEDNSDIVEHKNKGRLFRQTVTLYTDDAYLWKTSKSVVKFEGIDFYIKDGKEVLYHDQYQKFEQPGDTD